MHACLLREDGRGCCPSSRRPSRCPYHRERGDCYMPLNGASGRPAPATCTTSDLLHGGSQDHRNCGSPSVGLKRFEGRPSNLSPTQTGRFRTCESVEVRSVRTCISGNCTALENVQDARFRSQPDWCDCVANRDGRGHPCVVRSSWTPAPVGAANHGDPRSRPSVAGLDMIPGRPSREHQTHAGTGRSDPPR